MTYRQSRRRDATLAVMTSAKRLLAAAALLAPAFAAAHPGHLAAPGHEHGPELGFAIGLFVAAVAGIGALFVRRWPRRRETTAARPRSRT
jgi:hypothetical protein